MKTLWKEYGQTVITVLVAAMLLILCLWGFRITGSGMERPAAGADVGNNMDGKMLKDFHSRQVPVITYEDHRILTIADKIALSELFHAVDADGKELKIEITDIRNQEGKAVEDIYEKAGIYEIEVRAEDAYEKQTVSRFRIPVNGGGI